MDLDRKRPPLPNLTHPEYTVIPEAAQKKLPVWAVFHAPTAGYWLKFSISNNRTSDELHWLRYCHCAKLPS
ncbi:hypothetical protein J6590_087584 [Homalodisca vitripennis]|nr:hypothetical protein J6590_087584 [Homalodisca vitripennis]